jgi:hypothetical protein
MLGPKARGHWTADFPPRPFQHLTVGQRYLVAKPFTDYDQHTHEAGEVWTFLGSNFSPHEDGLSLFVSRDEADEWHIRLSWRPDEQGPVIDGLDAHIVRQT